MRRALRSAILGFALVGLTFVGLTFVAPASAAPLKDALAKLQGRYENTKTMEADFKQTVE